MSIYRFESCSANSRFCSNISPLYYLSRVSCVSFATIDTSYTKALFMLCSLQSPHRYVFYLFFFVRSFVCCCICSIVLYTNVNSRDFILFPATSNPFASGTTCACALIINKYGKISSADRITNTLTYIHIRTLHKYILKCIIFGE